MARRNARDMDRIEQIVLKKGLTYNDKDLAKIIAEKMKEKPMTERNIRKLRKKVLDKYYESSDQLILSFEDNRLYFHESLHFFEEMRRKALKDIEEANRISIFKMKQDRDENWTTVIDNEGNPVIDPIATRERRAIIKEAYQRARDAQYHFDRVLVDSGNRGRAFEEVKEQDDEFEETMKHLIQYIIGRTVPLMKKLNASEGDLKMLEYHMKDAVSNVERLPGCWKWVVNY